MACLINSRWIRAWHYTRRPDLHNGLHVPLRQRSTPDLRRCRACSPTSPDKNEGRPPPKENGRFMRPAGLEPAAPSLGNLCSIHLSYGRATLNISHRHSIVTPSHAQTSHRRCDHPARPREHRPSPCAPLLQRILQLMKERYQLSAPEILSIQSALLPQAQDDRLRRPQ